MLIHYFKIAFRNLLKNPIRSLFIFISLAVGLTLFVFTSYIVRESAYGLDESLPHYKRMAFLTPTNYDGSTYNTSLSHLEKIKEHKVSGIEKWSISDFPSHTDEMTFEITPVKTISPRVRFCSVNKEFFDVFSFDLSVGSIGTWSASEALISSKFATRYYGKENPVGKLIQYKSKTYIISGVIASMRGSQYNYINVLIPFNETDNHHNLQIFALLDKTTTKEHINKQLERVQAPIEGRNELYFMKLHDFGQTDQFTKLAHYLVFIIGLLIFSTSYIQFLNILISSLVFRMREITLRKVSGATRSAIFWQFMFELSISLLAVTLLSFVFSELAVNWTNSLQTSTGMAYIILADFYVLIAIFMFILLLATALIVWIVIRKMIGQIARNGINSTLVRSGKHRLRNVFLVFQLVISFLFVGASTATAYYFRQLIQTNDKYEWFSRDECKRIFSANLGYEYRNEMLERIKNIPEIENYTLLGDYESLSNFSYTSYIRQDGSKSGYYSLRADTSYFAFCGIPKPSFESWQNTTDHFFINPSFAHQLAEEGTPGYFEYELTSTVQSQESNEVETTKVRLKNTVAGIIDDIPFAPKNKAIGIGYTRQLNTLYVRFHKGMERKGVSAIQSITREYISEHKLNLSNLNSEVNPNETAIQTLTVLFSVLSMLTILIAMFGIYSAVIQDTQRRQREVAIRKVNGATTRSILFLIGKRYFSIMAIAFLLTIPVLILVLRLIVEDTQKTLISNPFYWLTVLIIVSSCVLTTIFNQINKLSRTNPAEIIKKE